MKASQCWQTEIWIEREDESHQGGNRIIIKKKNLNKCKQFELELTSDDLFADNSQFYNIEHVFENLTHKCSVNFTTSDLDVTI